MPSSPLPQTLSPIYNPWKKRLALLGLGLMVGLAWLGLRSQFFILEAALVLLAAYLARQMLDILGTQSITLHPDKIVKTGFFSQTTIPTHALVTDTDHRQQSTHFFHGSDKNLRESIKIAGWYLSPEHQLWLESYLRNVYRVGNYSRQALSPNSAANVEFERAVSSFRFMAVVSAVYLLAYVLYATYLSWHYPVFNGYAPQLPEVPIRLLFVGIALGGYGILRQLTAPLPADHSSYTVKVQRAQQRAFRAALLANSVAWLGLPLFLLFGNKLDFYLLLLIGAGFHYDFYPRLSDWERLLQTGVPAPQSVSASIPRRSLQVSLALLGGLSLASYAGNPTDFRIQQQDCRDENGNPTACQHNSGGHGGSGSSYRGNSTSDHPGPVRRGGFGFFGGSHGSFGG